MYINQNLNWQFTHEEKSTEMPRLKRWILYFIGTVGLIWLVACGAMLSFRHDLIYPFRNGPDARQISGLPGARAETVQASDGTSLIVWHVPAHGTRPLVLYFMGNAGSLPSNGPRLSELASAGYGIVALNYRGAGGAVGEPSQAALTADALAVYDRYAIADGPKPVIYGTSLGAALAVQLAARRPATALILETPFARLCETAEHHYPLIPACLILSDERWESADAIGKVTAPVLVLHGDADQTIPFEHGQALFAAANEPKRLIVYPGGRHNDLRLHGAGIDILRFLDGL